MFSVTPIPRLEQRIHSFASGPPPELVAQTRGAMQWQTVSELSALGMLERIHSRQVFILFLNEVVVWQNVTANEM